MKKTFFFLFSFFILNLSHYKVQAQVFQNSDTTCQSTPILCQGAGGFCAYPITSIACRNRTNNTSFTAADFNNDGFTDCVGSSTNTTGATDEVLSVLINNQNANCGTGAGPFTSSLNYELAGIAGGPFGSVAVGSMNSASDSHTDILLYAGDVIAETFNTGTGFGATDSSLTTTSLNGFAGGENQFDSSQAEKTFVTLDCDGDGDLDSAVVAQDGANNIILNVLRNNAGAGLQDYGVSGVTNIVTAANPASVASLVVGDFISGNGADIAVAVNDSVQSKIVICSNTGIACHYNCSAVPTILLNQHAASNPTPFSIAAGDFNGDGNQDLVITEPGLAAGSRGIHYFYLNGEGAVSSNQHVTYDPGSPFTGGPQVLTTGCYNNDNVTDVAFTYQNNLADAGNAAYLDSSVDSSGVVSLASPVTLTLPSNARRGVSAIDTADFDHQGGDDIIVVGGDAMANTRSANVFMNALETFSATAGSIQTANNNSPVTISGATCSSSDINARFSYSWAVSSIPPGAILPTLSGSSTLNPRFTPTSIGDYVLTLSCFSRCSTSPLATVDKTVRISTSLETGRLTQGGCINSLIPAKSLKDTFDLNFFLLFSIPFFFKIFKKIN